MVRRYNTTTTSPTNPHSGRTLAAQIIAAATHVAANPTRGASRKLHPAFSGRMVSLPSSFSTSAKGWYHGGPTRHWTRAVTLRSTHLVIIPTRSVATDAIKKKKTQRTAVCMTGLPFSRHQRRLYGCSPEMRPLKRSTLFFSMDSALSNCRAPLVHAVTHRGLPPASTRSSHISHFAT